MQEFSNIFSNLRNSIWGGLLIVIIVYTFTNVAYFTLLTPKEMIESNAVAVVSEKYTNYRI